MPPEKKPEFKLSFFYHPDPFVQIVFMFLALLVFIYLINGIISLLTVENLSSVWLLGILKSLIQFFLAHFWLIKIVSVIISVICILSIIIFARKLLLFQKKSRELLYPQIPTATSTVNSKWQRVTDLLESINENDWRTAILEADIMLGDFLNKLSLPGESMGEKMKAVDKSDFITLDRAWEAHKVRNQIAHEGSGFILRQRQAREVIALYEAVFEEFKII